MNMGGIGGMFGSFGGMTGSMAGGMQTLGNPYIQLNMQMAMAAMAKQMQLNQVNKNF